jgi:uncharacterized protein
VLSPLEQGTLEALRGRLTERFGGRLREFVLFGSRARGEGHEESDLDVLVLVDGLRPEERRGVLDLCLDLELDSGLSIEPIVRDAATWQRSSALGREVEKDGVHL